ncbi:GNAT family N-acetyltransferase [Lyngbya aestuarii]|uniref:GNAT family N-acetyltransferase n=1 Tax=Lyngbya aestuarii TaxID=118322 RepID=UPI00403D8882
MKIRTYDISDTEEIMQLFYETIHKVNIRDYTQQQVDAWAPANIETEVWMRRLKNKFTYVAEKEKKIIGFAQLEDKGYIDCFYCHKDFQGQGIGTQLLEQIESKARYLGLKKLFTEASMTAKPFFESKKFLVVNQQTVELRGQKFTNFLMAKII